MRRQDVHSLDPRQTYWVPSVVSPCRNWPGGPAGCCRGARFLIDDDLGASRDAFALFEDKPSCLRWIMEHRSDLNSTLPGARISAVRLDHWLLGLD